MNNQNVEMFLAQNHKYFPPESIMSIRDTLSKLPDDQFPVLMAIDFKDPTTYLIISIFLGEYGVDRFLLGDIGMGILKLLTAGCCGVLWLIDLIGIQSKTKEANYNALMNALSGFGNQYNNYGYNNPNPNMNYGSQPYNQQAPQQNYQPENNPPQQ